MLQMLEPQALPSAMAGLPCQAESAETVSSGAEVPKPTTTIPTSSAGTPSRRAEAAAPSTNRSALHTSAARPRATARTGSRSDIAIYLSSAAAKRARTASGA